MNIERILRDVGGTPVTMGGKLYRFNPLWDDGPHVARVEDEDHQKVFLSIREGYRPYEGPIPKSGEAPVLAPAVTPPAPVAAPVVAAPVEPAAAADTATTDAPADDLESLDDAALRALFKSELGRAAPPKSKPETMIAQIRAMRDAGATE